MWKYLSSFAAGATVATLWWTFPRSVKQILVITADENYYIRFKPGMSWAEFSSNLNRGEQYWILDPTNEGEGEFVDEYNFDHFAKRSARGHVYFLERCDRD